MPAGELVTVPLPEFVTVRVYNKGGGSILKVAVTDLSVAIVTVHWFPFTESQPTHALKKDPIAGVAVNVTGKP